MVREFFSWWLGQLTDFLPERWRRLRDADALVISPTASLSDIVENVIVSNRHNGRETMLGRYAVASTELAQIPRPPGISAVLRLAEGDVLAKTLVLPTAAERQLDQVLAFEMDRETPFASDELFWTQRIVRRDRKTGRVWVRLLLVPRVRLAGLLRALEQAGIRPRGAEIAAGPDREGYLPFDVGDRRARDSARRWLLWPALVCCIVLALAAAVIPFGRQALALASIEHEMAADRVAATAAQKLRQEIDQLSGNVDLIDIERGKSGRPLATLAALTHLLPGDTYLTDLVQQQRKLTLTGRSAAASRLIAALAGGEQLRNATFAAPVTHLEASRLEAFTITVEVVP